METKKSSGLKFKDREEAVEKIKSILTGLGIANGKKVKLDNLVKEMRIILEA